MQVEYIIVNADSLDALQEELNAKAGDDWRLKQFAYIPPLDFTHQIPHQMISEAFVAIMERERENGAQLVSVGERRVGSTSSTLNSYVNASKN